MEPQGPFCQSCSMPLSQPELYGTEADGSKNNKYCVYCYKDGAFTMPNATLEQMIEVSAKGWSEQDPNMTYEQAKALLEKVVPQLERWRK